MLETYFQLGPLPSDMMRGWYDGKLVILSYLVATAASYIALDITSRLLDINNTRLSRTLWLTGGAMAMGSGIWSMHFIGMLAFKMNMPMIYDPLWTIISLLVAIGASWFALFLLKSRQIHAINMVFGGVLLGLAIAAMHYTGMHAMINMNIHFLPSLFFLSIVIAIVASEAALLLAIKSTRVATNVRTKLKIVSAFIMGAAICGMHYTGMAAAIFTPKLTNTILAGNIDPEVMAIIIAVVTFFIFGIAIIASTYKESLNQQLLLTARQAGMAEVAASVLHNVGNALNSINVSATLLSEEIQNSKLSSLVDLNHLINEHKNNLSDFIKNHHTGSQIPEFINSLSQYWQKQQEKITNELQNLTINVEHVRNIIATQQDLSRVSEFEEVISLPNAIEEAILVSGIDNQKHLIALVKEFQKIQPVLIDKVKLLQILVNLIHNAKDAVISSDNKMVSIRLFQEGTEVLIQVSDNGEGIPKENLTRIFAYGFTTKASGHGFGLHTSAILAKDMGGNLHVSSEGQGKGASFTLILPYKSS